MKYGELRVVSLISAKFESDQNVSYRVLTYTSKNEFYAIEVTKQKAGKRMNQSLLIQDDLGISTADLD